MYAKLSSFTSVSFFTLEQKALKLLHFCVTGYNIPEDGTSMAQRVLHDVRIKTAWYSNFALTLLTATISESEIEMSPLTML